MKVVAFNGSPRKDGNTAHLIHHVLMEIKAAGIETEMVHLRGPIQGCIACFKCFEKKDGKCALDQDIINDCISKMTKADGIILGSPTYFSDLTPELKALIDRAGFVAKANDDLFRHISLSASVCPGSGNLASLFSFFAANYEALPILCQSRPHRKLLS